MPLKRFSLSGMDCFQLLVDKHARWVGGRGHVAHLLLELNGFLEEWALRETLENHALTRKIFGLRLCTGLFGGLPKWLSNPTLEIVAFDCYNENDGVTVDKRMQTPLNPYEGPPISISLFQTEEGKSSVLFSVSHILFDFRGLQAYLLSLAGKGPEPELFVAVRGKGLKEQIKPFFRAVALAFSEGTPRMVVPPIRKDWKRPVSIRYFHQEFDLEKTALISKNIQQKNLGLTPSICYLAAVANSVNDTLLKIQGPSSFLWIPVPIDSRPKGGAQLSLGNHLSFIFYKLKSKELDSFATTVEAIRQQTVSGLSNGQPASFLAFVDLYKYMPLAFYHPMLLLPSWGKLSSVSFSSLGDVFAPLDEFNGVEVKNIINYPSNTLRPGVTFLFDSYKGKLRITSSWIVDQFEPEKQEDVLKLLEKKLLAAEG